jgi:hypothetical protein
MVNPFTKVLVGIGGAASIGFGVWADRRAHSSANEARLATPLPTKAKYRA